MLNISDTRNTNERRLAEIDLGGFFEYDDVLCRKVYWHNTDMIVKVDDDELIVMQMYSGDLVTLNRDTYVVPISDRQIHLEVED